MFFRFKDVRLAYLSKTWMNLSQKNLMLIFLRVVTL